MMSDIFVGKNVVAKYYLFFVMKFYLNTSNFILVLKISDNTEVGKVDLWFCVLITVNLHLP